MNDDCQAHVLDEHGGSYYCDRNRDHFTKPHRARPDGWRDWETDAPVQATLTWNAPS